MIFIEDANYFFDVGQFVFIVALGDNSDGRNLFFDGGDEGHVGSIKVLGRFANVRIANFLLRGFFRFPLLFSAQNHKNRAGCEQISSGVIRCKITLTICSSNLATAIIRVFKLEWNS